MMIRLNRADKNSGRSEETPAPSDLGDTLALYRADRLRPRALFKRLTGSQQMWWKFCQRAACSGDVWPSQQELDDVLKVIGGQEPPQGGGAVTNAAQAAYQVSSALKLSGDSNNDDAVMPRPSLVSDRGPQDLVQEAANHWRNGPQMPVPGHDRSFSAAAAVEHLPARYRNRARSVLTLLRDPLHDRGQAMVAICALLLAGARPGSRRSVTVSVVLAVREGTQIGGVTGELEVRELPGGPAGLYPDPEAMMVQRTKPAFDQALRLAWEFAGGKTEHRCVLWRVTLAGDVPGYDIDGSSLGAAFAISLQELLRRRPASRLLTIVTLWGFLTRLRTSCVITGELSNQLPAGYARQISDRGPWLAGVGKMPVKLSAISGRDLRLIAPKANKPASRSSIPSDVHVHWATTLRQADRYARRIRPVRTVGTGVALVALVGGSIGPALALHYHDTAQRQYVATVSAQLTSDANEIRSTNPALAAQLDLAAYRASPNAGAYTAMLNDESSPLDTIIPGQAEALALSPNGGELADVPLTGPVTLQNADNPAKSAVKLGGSGAQLGTSAFPVGFSMNGQILAAPAPTGGIRLWNIANPAHPVTLSPVFGGSLTSVVFSPNGMAVATGTQHGSIQLWDISNPARPVSLGQPGTASNSFGQSVMALMFSINGQSLYSGSESGAIDVWSTSTSGGLRLTAQPLAGVQGQEDEISFSQHGKAVVTDGSGNTYLYNLTQQGSPQALTGGPAAISPDGLTVATRDQAGNITLLNTTQDYALGSQLPVLTSTGEGTKSPGPMVFDADGNELAAGDSGTGIMLWHLPAGYKIDPVLPLAPILEQDSIDGSTAAIAIDNHVYVQNLTGDMPVIYQIFGAATPLDEAAPVLGADGHLLVLSENRGAISVWRLGLNGHAVVLDQSFGTGGINATLSANGDLLASTARDGTVSLWNLSNAAHPEQVSGSVSSDAALAALSPDGRTLALLDDTDSVHLWDLSNPRHPQAVGSAIALGGDRSSVSATTALALSPGGTMLAVATTVGTVRIWKLRPSPAAYGEALTSNFDSDYNFLTTRVDSVGVNSLTFSPDGETLSAINADSTIRSWNLRPAMVIRNICTVTAEALTAAVWKGYLPNDPYQPPCPEDAAVGQGKAVPAPTTSASASSGQAGGLCTSSNLTLSSHTAAEADVVVLVITNKSHSRCSLSGIPAVSLIGPPDPPLGKVYQLASTAQQGQAPVTLAASGQAHINLTYLVANPDDWPSGGGNPMWVPKTVKVSVPGVDATMTTPWPSRVAVLRQDMASDKGTFTGPFLAGNNAAASTMPSASPSATMTGSCAFGSVCAVANGTLSGGAIQEQYANDPDIHVAGLDSPPSAVTVTIHNIPANGTYTLSIWYENYNASDGRIEPRNMSLLVNRQLAGTLNFAVTDSWYEANSKVTTRKVRLSPGSSAFSIACQAGNSCHINVWKIELK